MSIRGPFVRFVLVVGLLCAGTCAIAGGLALRGPGLVAVGLAGTLAGCIAAGIARESGRDRRSVIEVAAQATGWTVDTTLVVAGLAALAGEATAVLAVFAALVGIAVIRIVRARRTEGPAGRLTNGPLRPPGTPVFPSTADARPKLAPSSGRVEGGAGAARLLPPVAALSTAALGQEWLLTTAALAGRLAPATRQSIVTRREETLDELERRDPDGFARWLAAGPALGSDPAQYVRGGPVRDADAA